MANHHYCKQIGPYKDPIAVVFTDFGGSYSLHYVPVSSLSIKQLQSTDTCICKLPPGYLATVEVWQLNVSTHKAYLFSFKLGPSPDSTKGMGSAEHVAMAKGENDPPAGICHDPECSEEGRACEFGKKPKCVDEGLECVDFGGD